MEHSSELVLIGKILSDSFYKDKDRDVSIDNVIAIDWFDFDDGVVHEVKKSDSFEDGHIWQVKYYIYYLKKKGVDAKGKINYPRLRREVYVELEPGDEEKIVELLNEIVKIVKGVIPPVKTNRAECRGCSYFEFCWS